MPPTRFTAREPDRACEQVSYHSSNYILEHLATGSQVRHDLLQPIVLVFVLSEPLRLSRKQTGILLPSVKVDRLSDPRLAADIGNPCAHVALLVDESRLRGGLL
jgi:hypothetical protein